MQLFRPKLSPELSFALLVHIILVHTDVRNQKVEAANLCECTCANSQAPRLQSFSPAPRMSRQEPHSGSTYYCKTRRDRPETARQHEYSYDIRACCSLSVLMLVLPCTVVVLSVQPSLPSYDWRGTGHHRTNGRIYSLQAMTGVLALQQ